MSTAAGTAIVNQIPDLNANQRRMLFSRVTQAIESRVWDPRFDGNRWHDIVEQYRNTLLSTSSTPEFEAGMDTLARRAGDLLSVKSADFAFFHKSRRKPAGRLASHFRYCQPNECYTSAAPSSGDKKVHVFCSRMTEDIGWLKVTKFPGAVGIDVSNQITAAIAEIGSCRQLILDLRGNESGGLAFVRLAGYLTPDRRTIGFSVTRHGAEHGAMDALKSFRWIPRRKAGLLWLAAKYGFSDPSVRIETEGLGPKAFHGRVVVLIDESTTGAGERIASFAAEEGLAVLVGRRTPGKLICSDSKATGNGFFVRIPSRAWYTPRRELVEGIGIGPEVLVDWPADAPGDPQLQRAAEIVSGL